MGGMNGGGKVSKVSTGRGSLHAHTGQGRGGVRTRGGGTRGTRRGGGENVGGGRFEREWVSELGEWVSE